MATILSTVIYKLSTLFVGFSLAYLGFKLFIAGIFEGGGDLDTTFNNNRLVLKKASPGIFFALFGTVVIVVSLSKGLSLEQVNTQPTPRPIIESKENEIALNTLKDIISGNQNADSISQFEVSVINDLFTKLENQKKLVLKEKATTQSRGIASE